MNRKKELKLRREYLELLESCEYQLSEDQTLELENLRCNDVEYKGDVYAKH